MPYFALVYALAYTSGYSGVRVARIIYGMAPEQQPKDSRAFEHFQYNRAQDRYLCPHGKVFVLEANRYRSGGKVYQRYVSRGEKCRGCTLRDACLKPNTTKRTHLVIPVTGLNGGLNGVRGVNGVKP